MRKRLIALVLGLAAAGCGPGKSEPAKMPASGTMMAGDSMRMMAAPMFPRVMAHLDSLQSATPAMHDPAMATHPALLDSLVRAMQTDLMHLGMNRDSAYEALADSAVKDLAAITAAPPTRQNQLLREHLARVHRLMAFYETMVGRNK